MGTLLGGSWVVIRGGYGVPLRVPLKGSIGLLVFRVISGVIRPLIWVITKVTLPISTYNYPWTPCRWAQKAQRVQSTYP